jgi:hypothetical protein
LKHQRIRITLSCIRDVPSASMCEMSLFSRVKCE